MFTNKRALVVVLALVGNSHCMFGAFLDAAFRDDRGATVTTLYWLGRLSQSSHHTNMGKVGGVIGRSLEAEIEKVGEYSGSVQITNVEKNRMLVRGVVMTQKKFYEDNLHSDFASQSEVFESAAHGKDIVAVEWTTFLPRSVYDRILKEAHPRSK